LLLVFGCDRRQVYEEKVDFDQRIWPKQEAVKFDFPIRDTVQAYNIYYTIRYTNKYPYQNLYLQYYLEDSTGKVLNKELDNIVLFNPVTGIPTGNGLGDILTVQKKFIDHYRFPGPGQYGLSVEQFMRLDTLPEVLTIGIRVEKTEGRP
jgi:gliding motility-associated lipoprotein GldH